MTRHNSALQPFVEGKFNIRSIPAAHGASRDVEDGSGTLDLAGLQSPDSAGLALLVSWKLQYPELVFSNVPDSLMDIAKLSNTAWIFDS